MKKKTSYTGIGLVFGVALGAALGLIVFDNMTLYAGFGAGFGLVIGAIADAWKKDR